MVAVELVFLVIVRHVCPFQPVLQQHPDAGRDGYEGYEGSEKESADDDCENGCVFLLDVVRWLFTHFVGSLLVEIVVLVVQEIVVSL